MASRVLILSGSVTIRRTSAKLRSSWLDIGAPGRVRTCDRRIRSPLLCPLSYGGIGQLFYSPHAEELDYTDSHSLEVSTKPHIDGVAASDRYQVLLRPFDRA